MGKYLDFNGLKRYHEQIKAFLTDHRQLTHRDAAQQHPISAIDGLEDEIRRIPAPVEPITNQELEDLLQ